MYVPHQTGKRLDADQRRGEAEGMVTDEAGAAVSVLSIAFLNLAVARVDMACATGFAGLLDAAAYHLIRST